MSSDGMLSSSAQFSSTSLASNSIDSKSSFQNQSTTYGKQTVVLTQAAKMAGCIIIDHIIPSEAKRGYNRAGFNRDQRE